MSRLRRELSTTIETIARNNGAFQAEIRETLARLDARKKADQRGTVHGLDFEGALGAWLRAETVRQGDAHEAVGEQHGEIPRSKKGDHLVELGAECKAGGARIVWEAKEVQGFTLKKAFDELDQGRKNRRAQMGVFVFSRTSAPEDLPPFLRRGSDFVVIWDAKDPSTDLVLTLVYAATRALAVRECDETQTQGEAAKEIEGAVRLIEKRVAELSQIETWATTIENNGRNISKTAARIRESLAEQVAGLEVQVASLRSVRRDG